MFCNINETSYYTSVDDDLKYGCIWVIDMFRFNDLSKYTCQNIHVECFQFFFVKILIILKSSSFNLIDFFLILDILTVKFPEKVYL